MTKFIWKPYQKNLAGGIVRLWNRAMGVHFPMTLRLLRQNVEGAPSFAPDDSTVILRDGDVVGYVLTKRFREDDPLREQLAKTGWIDAIIVDPAWQHQGLGRDLMSWAIYRLRSDGVQTIRLGGGFRHFFPGPPAELPGLPSYFSTFGFTPKSTVHDLRGNLRGSTAPPSAHAAVAAVGAQVRPCRPEDVPALMSFFQAEFPGRWRFDTKRFLDLGGNPNDIIILCQVDRVLGFAQIYDWRSAYQAPPLYWRSLLGRRCGGLGPIGVAAGMRGKGLGLALLQLALQEAARRGVEVGVIDWTSLTDFYARVGFTPWKTYVTMEG